MNAGILTSGHAPPAMPYPLLGRRTPTPTPDAYYHPEAADWERRVRANGGTVPVVTLQAVSRFCNDIDRAGLRDRFYRLSLMCGDNLSACLVPLYRNTTPDGAVLGNATDTNNNFVSADYSQFGSVLGGLKGNNNNKYLSTGVNLATLGASAENFHMAIYVKEPQPLGSNRSYIGAAGATSETQMGVTNSGSTETGNAGGSGGLNVGRTPAPAGVPREGLLCFSSQPRDTSGWVRTYYINQVGARAFVNASLGQIIYAPDGSMEVFRSGGSPSSHRMRGYSFGLALTAAQVGSYLRAIETFNEALGRRV